MRRRKQSSSAAPVPTEQSAEVPADAKGHGTGIPGVVLEDNDWDDAAEADGEYYSTAFPFGEQNSAQEDCRWTSAFVDIIAPDSSTFPSQPGRYHLYAHAGCPWSHKCMIVRALKGLEEVVTLSLFEPCLRTVKTNRGSKTETCFFSRTSYRQRDPEPLCMTARSLYLLADPNYEREMTANGNDATLAAYTVPFLWDRVTKKIVNNDVQQCMQILSRNFGEFGTRQEVDLCPLRYMNGVDKISERLYHKVNHAVYKVGFARSRVAMREARDALFNELNRLNNVLSTKRFLCGDTVTEADVCLFVTLVRFDLVYHRYLKCDTALLKDLSHLHAYTRDLYALWGWNSTVSFQHIVGLYGNKKALAKFVEEGGERTCKEEFGASAGPRRSLSVAKPAWWTWTACTERVSIGGTLALIAVGHALLCVYMTGFDWYWAYTDPSELFRRNLTAAT